MIYLFKEDRNLNHCLIAQQYDVTSTYYLIVKSDIGCFLENLGGNTAKCQIKIEAKHVGKIWRVNRFKDGYINSELFENLNFKEFNQEQVDALADALKYVAEAEKDQSYIPEPKKLLWGQVFERADSLMDTKTGKVYWPNINDEGNYALEDETGVIVSEINSMAEVVVSSEGFLFWEHHYFRAYKSQLLNWDMYKNEKDKL